MNLIEAINSEETFTENGMPTYSSSLNNCVDLFFQIGASRGKDIIPQFSKAINEDTDTALRVALWSRDVREGAGERQLFKNILKYLAESSFSNFIPRIIPKVPELGRFDDLICLMDTKYERDALRFISHELEKGNGLCAKWIPRKGVFANKLRRYLNLTPKTYRKLLVELTNVVEQKMCANDWESIEFGKIPSLAAARYQNAFNKHVPELYEKYKENLKTGKDKINAGAVYPYDVLKSLKSGDKDIAVQQWNSLPDYLDGNKENLLCLVDVSGSMDTQATGNLTCLDVAISLGLYISERSKGIFQDCFITFSEKPKLEKLRGDLLDKYTQIIHSNWGGNTDIEKVFDLILNAALTHSVSSEDMPTKLIILSDMQFDDAFDYPDLKIFELIEKKYSLFNYKVPDIIFWNLRNSNGVPITFHQNGAALVSGFSPSIMKSILACTEISPVKIMMETINKDRYEL